MARIPSSTGLLTRRYTADDPVSLLFVWYLFGRVLGLFSCCRCLIQFRDQLEICRPRLNLVRFCCVFADF